MCCDGKQLLFGLSQTLSPNIRLQARTLHLTLALPGKSIFAPFYRRKPKTPLTHIWNSSGLLYLKSVGTQVRIQLWSPFTICCPLDFARMLLWVQPPTPHPPTPLEYSTQHSCLLAWPSGDKADKLLLMCVSVICTS